MSSERCRLPTQFSQGDAIIKQGDKSDNMDFYVLASGVCDISIEGKGTVMKATKCAASTAPLLHATASRHCLTPPAAASRHG